MPSTLAPTFLPALFRRSALLMVAVFAGPATAAELSTVDFKFDGPYGSQGARIEKVAENHFKVTLGHAPKHTDWCNMLYFQIVRNAKGNQLRLDVTFPGGNAYRFNHNSSTWSYDAKNWQPIEWQTGSSDSAKGDTLLFSEFTEETVYFGQQVPMSYEDLVGLMNRWEKHPHATVHVLGKSLGKRNIYRLEVTDPKSPHSKSRRWGHFFANQHPGEHNSQWRMAGMVDWLLSDEGADCRRRSICHFVLMTSPDGPSHGWYRVNGQGVDMNRSYFADGSDKEKQAHEAYVVQHDLEQLMKSDTPMTDLWSMHTWGGPVEPILLPGPEIGKSVGPWEEFRDILRRNAPADLIEPLKTGKKQGNPGAMKTSG